LKNIRHILLFLFIGFYTTIFSQNEVTFEDQITELNALGKQIISSKTDEAKYQANIKHKAILKTVIETHASFDFDFSALKTVSVLQENNLKIYNWAIPLADGTFEYFSFFQIRKDDKFNIVELTDKSENMKSPEYKSGTYKNWYGALYYKIIYEKKLGENIYTLLGWDGNNLLTNKKLIDVVTINGGIVRFGAPIFKTKENRRVKRRIIFEYAEGSILSLKYHPKLNKIIFNQLGPVSSDLEGIYEYYVPNLKDFDAYFLNKQNWILEIKTDVTNQKSIKDSRWEDPNK